MKKLQLLSLVILLYSCNDTYKVIDEEAFKKLAMQDTLVRNSKILVMMAGDSITDKFPHILVKPQSERSHYYLFDYDCELENDSTLLYHNMDFIIGDVRNNGLWVHTDFCSEGIFPFEKKGMKFSVDSLPVNWDKSLPTKEGIYYYQNDSLILFSNEQSADRFKTNNKDGFYFIPNKGRLFDRININDLD